MNRPPHFYHLDDEPSHRVRELAPGVTASPFAGERSMVSIVRMQPNAESPVHCHDEEQWGVLLEGSGVRMQDGARHRVRAGDFWRTPGGTPHGFRAGPNGAFILDLFAPPRSDYLESRR